MSSTKELIKNAIKDAEITDYIMLIRGECMTVILVEDFIKDIVFGGELICDTLLGCWKTMGQFDGGTDPENGDNDPCNCDPDFVKIHFPKGEGVRIITNESQAVTPDSVYILKVGDSGFQLIVVDEEGNKRNLTSTMPVVINIESSDGSIDVSETDGSFDLKANFPVTNGSSKGTGIPIYSKQNDSTVLDFASLITTNLKVETQSDGSILIDLPESGSTTTSAYYVNKNYNPTASNPSNGTRARPYKTLTEAVNAYIGTGTRLDPNPVESGKNMITLLSDIDDAINPTINGLVFRLEGNVKYKYTGANAYVFDMVPLYNAAGLPLTRDINLTIQGEGIITRSSGFGHIQNENATSNGSAYMSLIRIENEGEGLEFIENENYSAYVALTKKDGTPLLNGGIVYGANIPPTTPIFNIIGESPKYWGIDISGQMCTIRTMSQVAIRINSSKFYSHNTIGIKVEVSTNYISYQTRLVDYMDGTLTREVYYQPYAGRNNYEILSGSTAQIDSVSFAADQPTYTNVNSIFSLTDNSTLYITNDIKSISDLGAVSFIEYSGSGNSVSINNGKIVSRYTYFIKGDNVNLLNLLFIGSNANNILSTALFQTNITTVSTDGTLSSIKGNPYITGIPGDYADNTTALAALGRNVIYTSVVSGRVTLNITR